MAAIPPPWEAYSRMQEELAHRPHLDDHAWGLEAGMNRLLDDPPRPTDIERTIWTASRKERRRRAMRRTILTAEFKITSPEPETTVDARWALDQVRRQLNTEDWSLLLHLADGYTYQELSVIEATTPGSLRVRVYRLRRALRPMVGKVLDRLVAG